MSSKISHNISLSGLWHYVTDAGESLTYESALQTLGQSELAAQMKIPSNWQTEGLDNFSGAVWFARYFDAEVPEDKDTVCYLEFSGVDYFADVWLNDTYLGGHEGYFQSFGFDVTGLLRDSGKNILVVRVTSPLEEPGVVWPLRKKLIKGIFSHHDCRPGGWNLLRGQEQNTGGIWNEVSLNLSSKVHISSIKVAPYLFNERKMARLTVSFDYLRHTERQLKDIIKLEISLKAPDNTAVEGISLIEYSTEVEFRSARGSVVVSLDIADPKLWNSWDLGKPWLYVLKLQSELFEEKSVTFGIRDIYLDKEKNFWLNGKKLFLRGTNIIPTQFLSTLDKEKIREIVSLIRQANINLVRVHAHVSRRELYEEFDRQGIILWQDFALQWTYDDTPEFAANASRQIKDMVRMLFNHPSIAFWCCHNEPGEQIEKLDPILKSAVLSVDNSRIVRLASNYEEHPYDGWYWGSKEHFAAVPMGPLVTEFGAQALPERSSLVKVLGSDKPEEVPWEEWEYHNFQYEQTFLIAGVDRGGSIEEFIENSQDYQASYLKTAIDFYRREKNRRITGIFQFMFIDCWPSITWSVVDFYSKIKKGYYSLQNAFQPVYVSVRLRQKKYLKGGFLNIDLWILNDLDKDFLNCSLEIKAGDIPLGKLEGIDVARNCNLFYAWESLKFTLPDDITEGEYTIYFRLYDSSSNSLSHNSETIALARKTGLSE